MAERWPVSPPRIAAQPSSRRVGPLTTAGGTLQTITLSAAGQGSSSFVRFPGKILAVSSLPVELPISDNFNRADGTIIGTNWGVLDDAATGDIQIFTNVIGSTTSGSPKYYWKPQTFLDFEATLTLTTVPALGSGQGIFINGRDILDASHLGNWNGYEFGFQGNGAGAYNFQINRITNGGSTNLTRSNPGLFQGGGPYAISAGDKMKLRINGNTIEGWQYVSSSGLWQLRLSATDSTYPSAGFVGIEIQGSTLLRADDFSVRSNFPSTSFIRVPSHILSSATSPVSSFLRSAIRTLSALPTHPIATIIKTPSKIFPTLTGQGSASLVSIKIKLLTLTAAPTHPIATLLRIPQKILSAAPTHPIASIINLVSRTLSVAPAHPIASVIRIPSRIFSISSSTVTSFSRIANKILSIAVSQVTTLATQIISGERTTGVARFSLAAHPPPLSRTNHKIYVKGRITTAGSALLHAALYEGATNVSGNLVSSAISSTLTEYALSISDAAAASITSYSDLEVRLWGTTTSGGTITFEVSELYLKAPGESINAIVFNVIGQGSAVILKVPSRILSVIGQTSTAIIKLPTKVFSALPTHPIVTFIKSPIKILTASPVHPTASIINLVSKVLSAAPTHPVATFLRIPQKILSVVGQGSAALITIKIKLLTLSTVGQASATTIKMPIRILSVIGQGSASMIRLSTKIFSATPTHPIASFTRLPARIFSVTGQGSSVLSRLPQKVFSVAGQGSATFIRSPLKIFFVTGQGSSVLNRITGKVFTVVGQGSATLIRLSQRIFAVVGQGSAVKILSPRKIFAVVGQGSAILSTAAIRFLTLIATGQGSAVFSRSVVKILSALSQGSAATVKMPIKIFSVIGQASATLDTHIVGAELIFSVVGQGSAKLSMSVVKIFSIASQGFATITKTISRVFSVISNPSVIFSWTATGFLRPSADVATDAWTVTPLYPKVSDVDDSTTITATSV